VRIVGPDVIDGGALAVVVVDAPQELSSIPAMSNILKFNQMIFLFTYCLRLESLKL
jgi:hypothetical protein